MWRWKKLEALEGLLIVGGFEDERKHLWFASPKGVYVYDGYRSNLIEYPSGWENITPYSVHSVGNGSFYLSTSDGVLYFNSGWEVVLEFEVNFPSFPSLFAENREGLVVVGTPDGIYELQGPEAKQLISLPDVVCSMAVSDRGELFVATLLSNEVSIVSFDAVSIADSEAWRVTYAATEEVDGMALFKRSGSVAAVNFFKNCPAVQYSYEKDGWYSFDVGDDRMGHYHQGAYSPDGESTLVFSKTSIHVQQEGEWNSIESMEYEIPLNSTFSFVRSNGNLIIGGRGESIWEVDLTQSKWLSYEGLHYQCDSKRGNSWFISVDGKILEQNRQTGEWNHHSENVISTPTSILVSYDGYIWVSGAHNGVGAVCFYDGEKWTRNVHPEMVSSISHLSAKQVSSGEIVFGSGHEFEVDVGGLMVYEKTASGYTYYHVSQPFVPNRIVGIAETKDGDLWFGGYNLCHNRIPFEFDYELSVLEPVDWIDHLCVTDNGELYLASWERGLLRSDGESWVRVSSPDQVASDQVFFVLADAYRKDNLWVATNECISRYDGENWIPDAIQTGVRLNREGCTLKQSSDGALWINLTSRDWYFRTALNQKSGEIDDQFFRTLRYTPETDAPRINIEYYDRSATEPANVLIQWTGMDRWSRTQQDMLKYSYRVNGEDWSPYEYRNQVVLMSQKGGHHRIEVRVRDTEGNVCEVPASVEYYVKPPIWKRPWFIVSGLLMITVILFLSYLLVRQRWLHLLQLEEFKLQFFTNLSHEIRTPLTVIMGPLEKVLKKLPEGFDKKPVEIAYRNSQKMLHLVDQILEFRRVELGRVENHYVEADIIKDLKETILLLNPLMEEKNISLQTGFSHEGFVAKYDAEKLERIITNIVSNAIKYSHQNGSISVSVKITSTGHDSLLKLVVEDDGVGIPKKKMEHIFQPFYRVSSHSGSKIRGVGLGLSLVKSLIDALYGDIKVESPAIVTDGESKGTRFRITIPIQEAGKALQGLLEQPLGDDSAVEIEHRDGDKEIVLIAEDDDDIREFIADEFRESFQVITSRDGKEALSQCIAHIPDLIISDIMMPEMDGIELCDRIKSHPSTRHIPLILLTAFKHQENELRSLHRGADDFLIKPISTTVLLQKAQNAIHSRKVLREKYKQELENSQGSLAPQVSGSSDDSFLEKCNRFIDSEIGDSMFDVETLAKQMGMSRMTLYRKFKAVSDVSPSEYIRDVRMKRAAALLKAGNLTVSEVSDAVGFQELSNFSVAFKKHFGVPPSQYPPKEN